MARKPKKRTYKPGARDRMAKVGAQNLATYRAGVNALTGAGLSPEFKSKMDDFERNLIADLGGSLTTAERALVDSAKVSHGVITLAFDQLALVPGRLARSKGLSHTISSHQNSLLRALKALGLRRREKRAPTLQEAIDDELKTGTNHA